MSKLVSWCHCCMNMDIGLSILWKATGSHWQGIGKVDPYQMRMEIRRVAGFHTSAVEFYKVCSCTSTMYKQHWGLGVGKHIKSRIEPGSPSFLGARENWILYLHPNACPEPTQLIGKGYLPLRITPCFSHKISTEQVRTPNQKPPEDSVILCDSRHTLLT